MRGWLYAAGVLAAGAAFLVVQRLSAPGPTETVFQPNARRIEAAPLCPWRDPDADIQAFFGQPASYETQIRILSGQRLELQEKLGRPAAADENSLYVYRVRRDGQELGTVLTRRVKGEYGAIELVLAVASDRSVLGLRIQDLREPEGVTKALEDPAWLAAFKGKRVTDVWQLGKDLPSVPHEATPSAQSIVDGAHSLLVLLSVAEEQKLVHHHG